MPGDFRCLTATTPDEVVAAAGRVMEARAVTTLAADASARATLERLDRVGWWAVMAAVASLQTLDRRGADRRDRRRASPG